MAKKKKRQQLPRKGAEAVRFIERNAEILSSRQEGAHVKMLVRGPKGTGVVIVPVHGSKEMSTGVWHKTRNELIRIGVLSVIILLVALAAYLL